MKRILLSLTAIFVVMTIAARTQLPRTVQGVPYTPKAPTENFGRHQIGRGQLPTTWRVMRISPST